MTLDTTFSPSHSHADSNQPVGFGASLGKDANILATYPVSPKNNRSAVRLKLLDTARSILARHDIRSSRTNKRHRTRNCHAVASHNQEVYITLNKSESASRAGLSGLQTCGSICSCPVCATKKMTEYGQDIRKALIYAEQQNLRPVMLTLTARHTRQMTLKYFKDAFRDSWNYFQRHRRFKAIKESLDIQHTITSREITHGRNGWHYHMHILLFVPVSSVRHANKASKISNNLQALWMQSLQENGLDAKETVSANLSGKNSSDTYLAKLGFEIDDTGDLAYELTGNENKGKTVFDLLAMAHYGDIGAESLYVEYVNEMQSHNWITFSHGFRELFEDIDLDEGEPLPENQVLHNWLHVDSKTWYAVARLGKVSQVVEFSARHRNKERLRCLLKQLSDQWYYQTDKII